MKMDGKSGLKFFGRKNCIGECAVCRRTSSCISAIFTGVLSVLSAACRYTRSRTTRAPMALTMPRMEYSCCIRRATGFPVAVKSKGCESQTSRQQSCDCTAYQFRKIWRARRWHVLLLIRLARLTHWRPIPIWPLRSQPSLQSEETPKSSHHRFGCGDVDTHPSLDCRRWHVQLGKIDESRCSRIPSVGSSANYSACLDIIHDWQESWQARRLSFCRNRTRRLRDELRQRRFTPLTYHLEATQYCWVFRAHYEYSVYVSA